MIYEARRAAPRALSPTPDRITPRSQPFRSAPDLVMRLLSADPGARYARTCPRAALIKCLTFSPLLSSPPLTAPETSRVNRRVIAVVVVASRRANITFGQPSLALARLMSRLS